MESVSKYTLSVNHLLSKTQLTNIMQNKRYHVIYSNNTAEIIFQYRTDSAY